MRARPVERMDAARAAEHVLCRVRAERGDERLAGGEREPCLVDDQVQEALLRADRAIAVEHVAIVVGELDDKPQRTAVAATVMARHGLENVRPLVHRHALMSESAELSAVLEAALVRELRRLYDRVNEERFAGLLARPVFALTDTGRRFGQWTRARRALELSRTLVLTRPWLEVTSVLEHEMAHQFVDEVLGVRGESPHGPTFQRVCAERGIDARAAGAPVASTIEIEDRALDKIRKLLALAGSSNQHEAEIAMRRAHELMLRHNIEQTAQHAQHAGAHPPYEVRHLGTPSRRANPVEADIVGLLSECFFVEVIRIAIYLPHEGRHAQVYEVMGTRANVEMAAHVFQFLLATADRLWRENRRDARVRSGRDRLAYQSGVIRGFRDKLLAERRQLEGTGLVWVGDGALQSFYRARYPRIRTVRRSIRISRAHVAGREAGRNVVLHKPVTASTETAKPRLLRGSCGS